MLYMLPGGHFNLPQPSSKPTYQAPKDIKASLKILIIRGLAIITYLLLGALVFSSLERKASGAMSPWRRRLEAKKHAMLSVYNVTERVLQELEELFVAGGREIFVSSTDWDYYQSLYFASTVTTTIGYGHITPTTTAGRMFLIIFALVGIPLNILALASVGEHITLGVYHLLSYASSKCCRSLIIHHINIKVMLVCIFLMFLMLFLGGLLYCLTEDWTYSDSIYYCFVALATIGLGDLVPNRGKAPDTANEKALWFVRALYLCIGLSLVSTVFTSISKALKEINSAIDEIALILRRNLKGTDNLKFGMHLHERADASSNLEPILTSRPAQKHRLSTWCPMECKVWNVFEKQKSRYTKTDAVSFGKIYRGVNNRTQNVRKSLQFTTFSDKKGATFGGYNVEPCVHDANWWKSTAPTSSDWAPNRIQPRLIVDENTWSEFANSGRTEGGKLLTSTSWFQAKNKKRKPNISSQTTCMTRPFLQSSLKELQASTEALKRQHASSRPCLHQYGRAGLQRALANEGRRRLRSGSKWLDYKEIMLNQC